MRTLLLSMLLVAAPAAAEPEPEHELAPRPFAVDLTELSISGSGGVDPFVMRSAFDKTIDIAYRCVEAVKPRPAKLTATVTLKFRIDNHGAVAKASAVGLPSVNNCIATAVKAIVFNTPNKGAMDLTEKLSFWTPPAPGILGSTAIQRGGAFESLTGTADVSSGFDDTPIHGGLVGSDGARSSVPLVSIGQPNAQGDLDKAIIRRYVKRNVQKIQYCYEKQLLDKPGLAGTVQTQFMIGGDGKVTSSTGAGFDAAVASCVAEVILHIEFPRPKNNAAVVVINVFVFHATTDNQMP
jgi:hypothetical protein